MVFFTCISNINYRIIVFLRNDLRIRRNLLLRFCLGSSFLSSFFFCNTFILSFLCGNCCFIFNL